MVPTLVVNATLWQSLPLDETRITWAYSLPTLSLAMHAAHIGAIYLQEGIYGPTRFCKCNLIEVTQSEIILTLFPYAL